MRWTAIALLIPIALAHFCTVYITEVGCPHCAKTDPIVLSELPERGVVVIEYEIRKKPENAWLLDAYAGKFGISLYGVPFLIFNESLFFLGDAEVESGAMMARGENPCYLLEGYREVGGLDFNQLKAHPTIWYRDRAIEKGDEPLDNALLHRFLFEDPEAAVAELKERYGGREVEPVIYYSFGYVEFGHALKVRDWTFYWEKKGAKSGGTHSWIPLICLLIILAIIIALIVVWKLR